MRGAAASESVPMTAALGLMRCNRRAVQDVQLPLTL